MRAIVSAFALLAVCTAVLAVPPGSEAARPLATGITTVDTVPQGQLGYDRIRSAGANFTRLIVRWSNVAPASEPESWDPKDHTDPNYNWAFYDAQIEQAEAAGLNLLVQLYSAPEWAERCDNETPGILQSEPRQVRRILRSRGQQVQRRFR